MLVEPTTEAIALVQGQPMTELPKDLYIPPEALEVFLETFQGPLDVLLYLIKKQNLNILDIPVAEITRQYMHYVELMKTLNLELAAEYLVMAALLAEIKSRLLLPRPSTIETEEKDPRAELIRRLQAYEQIKAAAEQLDQLPQLNRDIFVAHIPVSDNAIVYQAPSVDLKALVHALLDIMQRATLHAKYAIQREGLSIRERMGDILSRVRADRYIEFHQLFTLREGKAGVVVTFIAILELLKQSLIDIVQQEPYSPIHIKAASV